ncbi:zinc finger and BTB domain-containing protein 14-like isoform X1, partial [Arapaima gigas]
MLQFSSARHVEVVAIEPEAGGEALLRKRALLVTVRCAVGGCDDPGVRTERLNTQVCGVVYSHLRIESRRMSKIERLNARVAKLLAVAVHEVLEVVKETVSEYQEKTARTQ